MARSPEQKKADADLEAAIAACRRAYNGEPEGGVPEVLGSWLVVAAATRSGSDEDTVMWTYDVLLSNGALSDHEVLGLLEVGRRMYEDGRLTPGDDG